MPNKKPVDITKLAIMFGPAVVILVLVGGGLLYSKGYFSSTSDRRTLTAAQKEQSAKFAETDGFKSEAPVALANSVFKRIKKNIGKYDDPRFTTMKETFQQLEQKHKKGQLTHGVYGIKLNQLYKQLLSVERDNDSSLSPIEEASVEFE